MRRPLLAIGAVSLGVCSGAACSFGADEFQIIPATGVGEPLGGGANATGGSTGEAGADSGSGGRASSGGSGTGGATACDPGVILSDKFASPVPLVGDPWSATTDCNWSEFGLYTYSQCDLVSELSTKLDFSAGSSRIRAAVGMAASGPAVLISLYTGMAEASSEYVIRIEASAVSSRWAQEVQLSESGYPVGLYYYELTTTSGDLELVVSTEDYFSAGGTEVKRAVAAAPSVQFESVKVRFEDDTSYPNYVKDLQISRLCP